MKAKHKNILLNGRMACALLMLAPGTGCKAAEPDATTSDTSVTAIDICLEPDATMVQHAEAVNARLRGVFPEGFALDASHRPHITLVQRFVRTADLDQVYAAAGKALANHDVAGLK